MAPVAAQPPLEWEPLVDRVEQAAGLGIASTMRMQVRVVSLTQGRLRYVQPPEFRENIAPLLRTALAKTTGDAWQVEAVSDATAAPTLVERDEQRQRDAAEAIRRDPLVAATLAAFPDAELIDDDRQAAAIGGARNWRR